ncbi:MAG: CE1759 family FMN reductase [Canibacter sp.]
MTDNPEKQLVVVHAGTSESASTKLLADRLADSSAKQFAEDGIDLKITVVSVKELSEEIATAMVSGIHGEQLQSATQALLQADGVIAATPIYKAEASGLFSSFFHVLDRDLMIAKPVLLAATAGSSRHSLVVDHQIRALFAYMRSLTAPTSVFAAPEDWNEKALDQRVDRAAKELKVLIELNFFEKIQGDTFSAYQRDFGGVGGTNTDIDFESDLMRLATGGSMI